jgi:hypothetical protein
VQYQNWDFDWRNTASGYELNSRLEFKNYWFTGLGGSYETHSISNADLRGGPALFYPGTYSYWAFVGTDQRKKLQLVFNPQWRVGLNGYMRNASVDIELNYRPTNALAISVAPSFSKNRNEMQYVATIEEPTGDRYIVGEIDQTIARVSLRMTYMITPNLSVQYWGQPFGSSGKYSNFKMITHAGAKHYEDRYAHISSDNMELNDDDEYMVDDNHDGKTDYTFSKPDFNFGQFRSNMVVRWEYIPGSTLFLVWTQEMNGSFYDSATSGHTSYSFDFPDKAHNIFLVKYTYRFIL